MRIFCNIGPYVGAVSARAATPSPRGSCPEPFSVTWIEETGSTNSDLVAAARDGAAHGLVLVADHQTAGRGRIGRRWIAPPGGALLCSVLLRPAGPSMLHGAVWAVALAARAAVRPLGADRVELKWPNDLMVADRKLAGILAEGVDVGGTAAAVVVGIGLNVGWAEAPAEVAGTSVTLEELAGRRVDRAELLQSFLTELAPLLALWTDDPPALLEDYRTNLATLGRRVRVTLAAGDVVGEAIAVTPDGALVLQTSGGRRTVTAGDVVHLRT